jgi:hypothetical protein
MLPFVRRHLARFQDRLARYEELKKDVSVLRLVSSSGSDGKNPDAAALGEKEQGLTALMTEMQGIQHQLTAAGCVPKSIGEGLIDFFALKDDRLVFLCWKQGEDGISAWHTLEGGYGGRRPIETFLGNPSSEAEEA